MSWSALGGEVCEVSDSRPANQSPVLLLQRAAQHGKKPRLSFVERFHPLCSMLDF